MSPKSIAIVVCGFENEISGGDHKEKVVQRGSIIYSPLTQVVFLVRWPSGKVPDWKSEDWVTPTEVQSLLSPHMRCIWISKHKGRCNGKLHLVQGRFGDEHYICDYCHSTYATFDDEIIKQLRIDKINKINEDEND